MTPPPLRDPTGLLTRAPELEAMAQRDAALRRAIEQGRPLDAYRALYWAHRLRRLGDLGDVAATLLARRRVFLKAITTVPRMFTYNGIGTSMYGRSDLDVNDGSYVATLYLVVLFIPIFPIASYLVRDGQGSGRRSWIVMAKVPAATSTYFWQRAVALGVLGLVLVATGSAIEGYGHGTLHVVNGLDRPITAQLSGASTRTPVAPGEEAAIRTTVGEHKIEIRDGERVIESSGLDVPRGRGAVVWNVLGAAPIYLDHEIYSKEGASNSDQGPAPQILCGQSRIAMGDVDYVFSTPPKEISLPSGSSAVVKSHMGVAPGGWRSCINYLESRGDVEKAARLTLQVARATLATAATMGTEIDEAVGQLPASDSETFAKELLARDDSLEANRIYQNVLLESHQRVRAISEYDARLATKPGADSEYLALRVRPEVEEHQKIDAVVSRFPRHAYLRRAQALTHYAELELSATASACDALKELDPKVWLDSIDACVDGLVGVGRGEEALQALAGLATDSSATTSSRHDAEVLAYRVAHRIGKAAPEVKPDDDDEDPEAAPLYARARTGLPLDPAAIEKVKNEPLREALRVSVDARSNPDAALARVRRGDPMTALRLPAAVHVLLLAEASRRDDSSDVAARLAAGGLGRGAEAITSFVRTGRVTDEVAGLPLEMRAAMELARSRVAGLSAKERTELVALARTSDILQGPVTVALSSWPP
jgi:hypothetical protein